MGTTALTEAVFYILLSLDTPLHGYGIMQNVEHLSGGRVRLAAGTLYGALATLTERGARVTFCECYQRSAKHYDGAEEAMRWQSRGVTTLVVTSGEMLQQLWSLIPQWYREQWLLHCRVVVVSERLALQARELGWQKIQVADSADNDALLRALQ